METEAQETTVELIEAEIENPLHPHAILICGTPGAGKSHLAKELFKTLEAGNGSWSILDDPTNHDDLLNILCLECNLIITDVHLCKVEVREKAEQLLSNLGYTYEIIYFENNPEKCINNLKHRKDKKIIDKFDVYKYEIPEGVEVREIWQPEPEVVVEV